MGVNDGPYLLQGLVQAQVHLGLPGDLTDSFQDPPLEVQDQDVRGLQIPVLAAAGVAGAHVDALSLPYAKVAPGGIGQVALVDQVAQVS
jgi:hypothetical protein